MTLRRPIRTAAFTLGTFVKFDSPQVLEILGITALDFVVVDAEHAPFDRLTLDRHMMASRAAGLPALVRVPEAAPAEIQSALDLGAAGVLVPRVDDAEQARAAVAAAKYRGGGRGFSISPRAAGYGTLTMAQALDCGDTGLVLCQVESARGVEHAAAIAATPGVDGLFIGRADLALSMGIEDIRSPEVSRACEHIAQAALKAGVVASMFVPQARDVAAFRQQGIRCFVVGSDQSLLRQAAATIGQLHEAGPGSA
jgi:2-keto-3-deoxy-L-rhamnonate aldolase RhmA